MPAVYIWNRAFETLDLTIGGELGETGQIVEERFDGDGRKTKFKLSSAPLRPMLSIETPPERRIDEGRHFTVNYQNGTLALGSPPEKGRSNLLVRYRSTKGAGELKGLRLKLDYDVDVWASAEVQGSLVNQIVSSLLRRKDQLGEKGIRLTILGGRDLTPKDGVADGSFCKRVQCVAETNIMVKVGVPRIERVQLENPRIA